MFPLAILDKVIKENGIKTGYELLGEKDGLANGCRCGVSIYRKDEYDLEHASVHDDQEGFFVLEGHGKALIDEEEINMEPGVAFVVPKGVKHAMKKDKNCDFCKVFWFHSAAE